MKDNVPLILGAGIGLGIGLPLLLKKLQTQGRVLGEYGSTTIDAPDQAEEGETVDVTITVEYKYETSQDVYLDCSYDGTTEKDCGYIGNVYPDWYVTYSFSFTMPDHDVTIDASGFCWDDCTGCDMGSDSHTVSLCDTYNLSGTVKDQDGNLLNNATVEDPNGNTDTTNAYGNYYFSYSYGFSGQFTASKSGYESDSGWITLDCGDNTLNFTLQEIVYIVEGTVTDENGNALNNATVEGHNKSTTTDSNGNYSLEYDYGFSDEFTASKSGYNSQSKSITVNQGTNTLNFSLSEKKEINVDADKLKIENSQVWP